MNIKVGLYNQKLLLTFYLLYKFVRKLKKLNSQLIQFPANLTLFSPETVRFCSKIPQPCTNILKRLCEGLYSSFMTVQEVASVLKDDE